jgi:hypothetical protein
MRVLRLGNVKGLQQEIDEAYLYNASIGESKKVVFKHCKGLRKGLGNASFKNKKRRD